MQKSKAGEERGPSMKSNLLIAAISGVAALAMNSVYGISISGMWSWLGFQAADLLERVLQNASCVPAAIHMGAPLATMLLMAAVAAAARK